MYLLLFIQPGKLLVEVEKQKATLRWPFALCGGLGSIELVLYPYDI